MNTTTTTTALPLPCPVHGISLSYRYPTSVAAGCAGGVTTYTVNATAAAPQVQLFPGALTAGCAGGVSTVLSLWPAAGGGAG